MQTDPNVLVTEAGRLLMQATEQLGGGISLRASPASLGYPDGAFVVTLDHVLDHGCASSPDTALCIALEKQADREQRYQDAA